MRISPCSPRDTRTTVSTARSTLARRLVAQGQACFRQFDATRLAPEQLGAECPFKLLDLLAERGLLNAKPRRGSGDVQFFGDDDKVAE